MARSPALVATLAAALIAGSVGLAHAQAGGGGGGGGAGGTGGTSGSAGTTGATGTNATPGATQTNPGLSTTNPGTVGNAPGTNANPAGTAAPGYSGAKTPSPRRTGTGATAGGNHRQPTAGDLPRNGKQAYKRDQTEKNIDRLIGGICRGC